MPQGRIVLKRICQSRKLAALKTDGARLLYTWLLPNVDINGCFSGDEEVIKGQIFTRLRKSTKTINSYLADLASAGLIIWYESNGDRFLHIPDFTDKQPSLNPNKEAESTIPMPTPDLIQTLSGSTPLKVKGSKVKERGSKVNTVRFDRFYQPYPRKTNKQAAVKAFNKLNPDDALLEVMLAALEQQKLSDQWQRKIIPHPATWLNGRRWTDEMPHEETITEQGARLKKEGKI